MDKLAACKTLEANATWGHKLSKIKVGVIIKRFLCYKVMELNIDLLSANSWNLIVKSTFLISDFL